ncbi:hypothetical protein G7Y89_g11231 [Cudoniella acicularis]|uniref:Uncharacterized protein n=1 Tax=Cudoniella acicularis TaxID=354080 RepID=A0A8H4RCR2_9HELO|nr:hypothetical protein G7Y89_g11231 [Cudoniella acicularis]
MVLALLGGFLLSLGHHLFYASLDRKSVPTGSYPFAGKTLPKQQFNIFVGTALAFFVRTFLAVAVSTAYVQIFWRSTKNAKQSPTLAELDWAKAGLANVFNLFNLKRASKYPLLVLLAVIFWCVPIATIFTPATLFVENAPRVTTSMLQVPQFDFTTLNFVAELPSCNDVAATERDRIWTNIWNSYNATTTGSYAFLSWVPWSYADSWVYYLNLTASGIDRDLPFFLNVFGGSSCAGPPPSSVSTGGPASLFIAVLPESQNLTVYTLTTTAFQYSGPGGASCPLQTVQNLTSPISGCAPETTTFTPALVYENATLLRCDLVNTSYSVEFSYSSGVQDIRVSPNMTGNSPIVNASEYFIGPSPPGLSNISEPANCSSFLANPNPDYIGTPCIFDIDAMRLLSYQGIMAAFNQLVLGTIQHQDTSIGTNTTIMKTTLAQTEELAFIRDWNPSDSQYADLQTTLSSSAGWAYPGLANSKLPDTRGDLKLTLEQLFQNFTISLLTEPYFQPNYSSPFAPPQLTNVSLGTYQNLYNYDRATLWIAYGLSILFTTLAVIIGMIALILNGASYSNNFSTIIRVSRTTELNVEVTDQDVFGRDPLPSYLKHARLNMGVKTANTNAYEMVETLAEE